MGVVRVAEQVLTFLIPRLVTRVDQAKWQTLRRMSQSVESTPRTTVTILEGQRLLLRNVLLSLVCPVQMIQNLTFSDLEGPVDPELNPEEGPVKDPVVESTQAEDLEGVPVDLVVDPVEEAGTAVGLVLFVK